jgi:hypothetical protein
MLNYQLTRDPGTRVVKHWAFVKEVVALLLGEFT